MENFIHSVICFIAIVIIDNGIDKNICLGKRITVQDHYFQISM